MLHALLIVSFTLTMGVLFGIAINYKVSFLDYNFAIQFLTTDIICLFFEFTISFYIAYVLLRSSQHDEKMKDPLTN